MFLKVEVGLFIKKCASVKLSDLQQTDFEDEHCIKAAFFLCPHLQFIT